MAEHTADRHLPDWARYVGLALFLVAALAAGGIGSLVQGDAVDVRYLALDRPAWAPPSWIFGVVWPVLYVAIAVAGWRVWRTAGSVGAAAVPLSLWAFQLVVNAAWPGVFFGAEEFGWALVVIIVLDLLVAATIVVFHRVDRLAAWLLVPYLVWILYATALNLALFRLN